MEINKIYNENCLTGLKKLEDNSIDCCVTSPPYFGLRDYGTGKWVGGNLDCDHRKVSEESISKSKSKSTIGESPSTGHNLTAFYKGVCQKCGAKREDHQIGLEKYPEEYIQNLVDVFNETRRVLKPQGTLFLNLGDSYAGSGKANGQKSDATNFRKQKRDREYDVAESTIVPRGMKAKDLIGIPWMAAFALRQSGWYLRQDIIWHKPNPMPESVTDRCTKSHEYIFLLSKSGKYYFDYESIQEIATGFDNRSDTMMKGSHKYKQSVIPGQAEHTMASQGHERWKFKGTGQFGNRNGELNGLHSGNKYKPKFKNLQPDGQQPNSMHIKRAEGKPDELYPIRNKRSVWTVNTKPYNEAHFATFPEKLIEDCILAGCPKDGIVLDPFMGAGTTALVARKLGRNYIGFELNADYIKIAENRLQKELGLFIDQ